MRMKKLEILFDTDRLTSNQALINEIVDALKLLGIDIIIAELYDSDKEGVVIVRNEVN